MRRKKRKELEAQEAAAADTASVDVAPADEARLTPVDVQQVEFRLAFRGYSEQDVDAFLDRISEELARLYEENKRLREEVEEMPGAGAGPLIEDAQRRAEAIVREAREQAARTIADPEQAAALAVAAGAAVSAGGESAAEAVRAFLGREREFLQSIASVIQRHAEAVKEDVRRAKEEAEGWTPAPAAMAAPAAPPPPDMPPPGEPFGSAVSTAATAGAAAAIAHLEAGERPAPPRESNAAPEPVPAFDDDDPFAAYRLETEPSPGAVLEPAGAPADGDDDDAAWENPFLEGAATPAPAEPASAERAEGPPKGERDAGEDEGEDPGGEEGADAREGNPGEADGPPPQGSAEARRREGSDDGVDTLFWGET